MEQEPELWLVNSGIMPNYGVMSELSQWQMAKEMFRLPRQFVTETLPRHEAVQAGPPPPTPLGIF